MNEIMKLTCYSLDEIISLKPLTENYGYKA